MAVVFCTLCRPGDAQVILTVDSGSLAKRRVVVVEKDSNVRSTDLVSCGHPGDGTVVRIVNTNSCCIEPEGIIGEIWVAGPSKALGYWGKPELTHTTFEATLAGEDSGTAYLRTGDLGFLHKGELFVCGREKDLIIVNGKNYYPQDIERSVEAAHTNLRPGCSAAFSVTDSDDREGIVVMAEVRSEQQSAYSEMLTKIKDAVLYEHQLQCAEVVLLRPRTVFKTTSGKIQRRRCK